MTFKEAIERANGYAMRLYDDEGTMMLSTMLRDIRKAHDEEVKQALCKFPVFGELTEYDVIGNERHKVVCALKVWDPTKTSAFPGEPETHIRILYQILTGKAGGNVSPSEAAIAVRDRLIELLGPNVESFAR